jgi:Protein of unknown function (DUF1566)
MTMRPVALAVAALLLLPGPDFAFTCYDRAGGSPVRFALNGGEAFDSKTGLTWKRCSLGKAWDGKRGCIGETAFQNLDQAIKSAKAAGPEWRVPSGPELESIVDPSCGTAVVDKTVFPDVAPDENGEADYWTTNKVGAAGLVYFFDFMTGRADGHSRGFELAVRLVKTGK